MFGNIDEFGKRRPTTYNDPDKFWVDVYRFAVLNRLFFRFIFRAMTLTRLNLCSVRAMLMISEEVLFTF